MKRYKRKRFGLNPTASPLLSAQQQMIHTRQLIEIQNTLDAIRSRTYTANRAMRDAINSKESTTPKGFKALLLKYNDMYYENVLFKERY